MGSGEVTANPSEDHPPAKAPAISVPADAFGAEGTSAGHQSSALLIRVCPVAQVRGLWDLILGLKTDH